MTLYLQGKRVIGMDCVLRNSQGTFLGCLGNTMLGVLSAKDEGKLWVLRFNMEINTQYSRSLNSNSSLIIK